MTRERFIQILEKLSPVYIELWKERIIQQNLPEVVKKMAYSCFLNQVKECEETQELRKQLQALVDRGQFDFTEDGGAKK